jgi:glycosyltransferase involved in cell wall biosynthesis
MIVHNEDRYLRRAALNIADFCDRVLIAEHRSDDGTQEICEELARKNPKFEVSRIRDPREASEMLQPFASTPSWVFGVDGDEIYDPAGLAWMRSRLSAGNFARWWVVFGNVCNCVDLDETARIARGYLAPPWSASIPMPRSLSAEARALVEARNLAKIHGQALLQACNEASNPR